MWLITLFMFFLGRKAVQSSNKYMFIRLVIASVMAKMMLILLIIVVYVKLFQPDSKLFVLPFIGVYLIFSVFETLVLYRIALSKTASKNE
jgi:F0F1-type ATP synthase assembly protein I